MPQRTCRGKPFAPSVHVFKLRPSRPVSCIHCRRSPIRLAATSRPRRQALFHSIDNPSDVERRLPEMTISGHNMTMKRTVRIAELKARLSEYLRAVRRGETIAVLDRDTQIAQIVPVRQATALRIRKPAPGTRRPNQVPLPKALKLNVDVAELLLEERQSHR